MHNNIMAAGFRDRPPMLAPGRYPQWRSRFLRYYILNGVHGSLAVPEHTTIETPTNMSPENKAYFLAEKEAIHLILTGIGDDIYSTVEAYQTAQEMWEAIERSSALSPKPSIPSRSQTTTRHKGKEIAKPITPPSEIASEEDNDPKQAQRDKDMQKNLALIAKYFKKIYKPTNNNLRTSSNSKNKNVDMTPRYKNDDHSRQFGTQRTVNVAGTREMECKKPKRVKDSMYHKEKMLLCKQAKQGVPLQAEQYDWLADTYEEVDEQELEAHYSYMAKIQEVPTTDSGTNSELVKQVQNKAGYNVFANHLQHSKQFESISNTCLVETDDTNVIPDSPDMCEDDIQNEQNDVESDDERVALANLIANLKLDVDENKKIQKQLKKANTILAQELKECKAILAETTASVKPHHMIASRNSRISSKNMTRFSSNDMVHNHYLEEAKKRTQERSRNSEPSLIPSARLQSTANGRKPMPRRNTQTFRIWPATKNSFVMTNTVPIAKHLKNSKNDSCVTKFLKEVNS
nr:hypothetical protein [Tanacetum cinerariifolium]